jgi:hypothetical protein
VAIAACLVLSKRRATAVKQLMMMAAVGIAKQRLGDQLCSEATACEGTQNLL